MTTVAAGRRRLRAVARIAVLLRRLRAVGRATAGTLLLLLPLVGEPTAGTLPRRVQVPIAGMLLPLAVREIAPAVRRRIDANDLDSLVAVRVSGPALASVAAAPSAPRRVLPLPGRRSGGVRRLRRAVDRHGVVGVAAATGVRRLADTSSAALRAKRNHPARVLLLAVVIGVPTLAAVRRVVPLTDLVVRASAVMAGAVPPIAVPRMVGVMPLADAAASTDMPVAAGMASAARIAVPGAITPPAADITAVAVRPTTSAIAATAVGATVPTTVPMPPIGADTVARRSVAAAVVSAIMPLSAVDAVDTVIMASAVAVLSITDAAMSPASIAGKGAAVSLTITP